MSEGKMNDTSPAVVSVEAMAEILEDMAKRVRNGDCFGGSIEFHYADDFFGAGPNEYTVMGQYRIGNSQGQGGMRLICRETES